jgi:hypothetical protein
MLILAYHSSIKVELVCSSNIRLSFQYHWEAVRINTTSYQSFLSNSYVMPPEVNPKVTKNKIGDINQNTSKLSIMLVSILQDIKSTLLLSAHITARAITKGPKSPINIVSSNPSSNILEQLPAFSIITQI